MSRGLIRALLLMVAFAFVAPVPAFAKSETTPPVSGAREEAKIPYKAAEADGIGTVVRVIGVFLFVALLALASVYALKRFFPSFYVHSAGGTQHIRVIETRRLTTRTTLFLVELDGERILLAQSGDRIVNLHKTSATPMGEAGATPRL